MTFERHCKREWTTAEKKYLTTSSITAIARMCTDWEAEREKLIEALKATIPFFEEDMPDGPDADGIEYVCSNAYRDAYRNILAILEEMKEEK